jgi:hypothetical protein
VDSFITCRDLEGRGRRGVRGCPRQVREGDLDLVLAYRDPLYDGLDDCSAVLLGEVFPTAVEVFGFGDDFLLGEVLDLQEVDLALEAGYLCLELYLTVLDRLVPYPEAAGGEVARAVELEDLIRVGLEALRFPQEGLQEVGLGLYLLVGHFERGGNLLGTS